MKHTRERYLTQRNGAKSMVGLPLLESFTDKNTIWQVFWLARFHPVFPCGYGVAQ